MINNFWSFNYIVRRCGEKAEEYGIKVEEKSEYGTSSKCPFCHSENITTKGKLFKCLDCRLEAHRDVAGVLNIGYLNRGSVNGVLAHPLLLGWDRMRWKPKRAVNNQPMNALSNAETFFLGSSLPTFRITGLSSGRFSLCLASSLLLDLNRAWSTP
jgi:hypothetical protein